MRASQYQIATLKELPSEAQIVSHQLMLKAGLIRKLASGLYTWLPLGLKVLHKVEQIIRQEMDQAGALEMLMPSVQPAELWQETGRWDEYGKELLRFHDRHDRLFCYGPTHEEVVTDLIRQMVRSYKELPVTVYQIQTKFRDEIRPRFGVMRAREFLMKDAYSFHPDQDSLKVTYDKMYDAYTKIFTRLGLEFRVVRADNGAIGGETSHEFQVLTESGEDLIAYSDSSSYAANVELANPWREEEKESILKEEPLIKVVTPEAKSITEVAHFLGIKEKNIIKTLVVQGEEGPELLLVRGDHSLNEIKAAKLKGVKAPLTLSYSNTIEEAVGPLGFVSPLGFNGLVYADLDLKNGGNWVVGANEKDAHYQGFNFKREGVNPVFVDLREVQQGDRSPDGLGQLKFARGIEVGHIFQLGQKYSKPMNATFLDAQGKNQIMEIGCYGIGVSRVVAAAVEQCHDDKGIIWPEAMAPFSVVIVPMNYSKNETVKKTSDQLYAAIQKAGIEVLLDDRNERAGVLLHDSELLGFPHRLTVGERSLKEGKVEYSRRGRGESQLIEIKQVIDFLANILENYEEKSYTPVQ